MKQLVIVISALLLLSLPMNAQKKSKTETTSYSVSIDCQHCVDVITKELAFVKGVRNLECNIEEKSVDVTYRTDKVTKETIAEKIRALGYDVTEKKEEEKKGEKGLKG
jgi:mercuric ion binding protein